METKRRVLVFGDSHLLRGLAVALRDSPRLDVIEYRRWEEGPTPGGLYADVILVDGELVTPEQFRDLLTRDLTSQSIIISIDPLTYQLTVLSSPHHAPPFVEIANIVEILSVSLSHPPQRK